jgi:prolyl-tRNA synthetase
MGARVLDENGKERVIIMGSYGIGVERILTSCIEQNHDDNGFWLAPSIAPFTVVVVPTNMKDATLVEAAEKLAAELESIGYDVLLDDRDERAGVKFKDADLVGIPYRVNIGKLLAEGKVEVVDRATSTKNDVAADAVVEYLRSKYDPLLKNAPRA